MMQITPKQTTDKYEELKRNTKHQMSIWKDIRGIAPEEVTEKIEAAMLEWIDELTDALSIWLEKGNSMTDGELILARTNLGAIVECWLKFFYCVYYTDYTTKPMLKKGKQIDPEDLTFEQLKMFSAGKLWKNNKSSRYQWVESVQRKRNAIHAFKSRNIGTITDFYNDVDLLCNFVNDIITQLPDLENCFD